MIVFQTMSSWKTIVDLIDCYFKYKSVWITFIKPLQIISLLEWNPGLSYQRLLSPAPPVGNNSMLFLCISTQPCAPERKLTHGKNNGNQHLLSCFSMDILVCFYVIDVLIMSSDDFFCHCNIWLVSSYVNSSPTGQNDHHFTDDIFRCIFVNEIFFIFIKIPLKFVPNGPFDNNPAWV